MININMNIWRLHDYLETQYALKRKVSSVEENKGDLKWNGIIGIRRVRLMEEIEERFQCSEEEEGDIGDEGIGEREGREEGKRKRVRKK